MNHESETQNASASRRTGGVSHWQDPKRKNQVDGGAKRGDVPEMSTQSSIQAYIALWLFAVYLITACCGCRSYYWVTTKPDGTRTELWINTCLSDAALGGLTFAVDSNKVLTVEGYSQAVNDEAVKAISEGVSSAVIKAIAPTP